MKFDRNYTKGLVREDASHPYLNTQRQIQKHPERERSSLLFIFTHRLKRPQV